MPRILHVPRVPHTNITNHINTNRVWYIITDIRSHQTPYHI
jgi:hypothetical protein